MMMSVFMNNSLVEHRTEHLALLPNELNTKQCKLYYNGQALKSVTKVMLGTTTAEFLLGVAN